MKSLQFSEFMDANEESARRKIYAGEILMEDGVLEMLRHEKAEHAATQLKLMEANAKLNRLTREFAVAKSMIDTLPEIA